eukprot:gb/GEZN01002353.1/.p2 GENE.gb/GEZN01002353.1/~~gb/GEZN01002353.1/.p2  ORF type:complete len:161 (-),score=6.78 gb/GEZN01002353.1/:1183-1665(-)
MAQALSELYTAKDDLRQRKETGKRKRDNQEESESRPGGAPPRSFHLEKVGRQRDELRRQIEEHDSTHSAELSQVLGDTQRSVSLASACHPQVTSQTTSSHPTVSFVGIANDPSLTPLLVHQGSAGGMRRHGAYAGFFNGHPASREFRGQSVKPTSYCNTD